MAETQNSLIDLIRNAYFRRKVPGVGHTFSGVATPSFWGGATFGAAKDLLKGVGTQAGRAAQAFTSFNIPGIAPLEPFEQSPAGRLGVMADAVLMGLPTSYAERLSKNLEGQSSPTIEQQTKAHAGALGGVLTQDILPGRELGQLLSGEVDGRPITPEESGKASTFAALKTLGLGGLFRGKAPVKAKLTHLPDPLLERIRSVGEIEAAGEALTQRVEAKALAARARRDAPAANSATPAAEGATSSGPTQAQIRAARNLLPEEVAQRFTLKETGLFDNEEMALLRDEAMGTQIYTNLLKDLRKKKLTPQNNEIISEAIKRGAFNPRTISNLADIYAVPLEEMVRLTPVVFERTATHLGKGLSELSKITDLNLQRTVAKAMAGDVEAMRQYNALLDAKNASNQLTSLGLSNNVVRNIESVRLAAMLSQPATAARNAIAQGATFLNNIFEDTVAGTAELVTGKLIGEKRSLGSYYADLTGHVTTLIDNLSPKSRAGMEALLQAFPGAKAQLFGASAYEIAAGFMPNFFGKFKPQGFQEGVAATRNLLTTLTRAQEFEFRRLFFRSRLKSNLERLGIKDFNELMDMAKRPVLDENVRWALGDSVAHALKQTYAWQPEASLAVRILKFYKDNPAATALIHPFPRFVMNAWRYINERGPSTWFDLFSKDWRDALMSGAEGGFASRQAARMLGRSIDGMLLMAGAYAVRTSDQLAGPKYYLVQRRDRDGNPMLDTKGRPQFDDTRAFQPFNTYLFIGELIKHARDNVPLDADNPMNLSPNEWLDAILGIRSLNENALFAIVDQIRSSRSDDPEAIQKIFKAPLGQYISSFFVPGRAILDGAATFEQSMGWEAPEAWQRDTEGQELTGPMRSNIPGLNRTLPPRIDPFTGEPEETRVPLGQRSVGVPFSETLGVHLPAPAARQLTGRTLRGISELEQLVQEVPDMSMQQLLLGNQPDQPTSQLVAEEMGRILNTRSGADTIGGLLARTLREQNLSPKGQREILSNIFESLRGIAQSAAMARNPDAFAPHLAKKAIPKPAQRLAEPYIDKLLGPKVP